jgi:hypothetical protein
MQDIHISIFRNVHMILFEERKGRMKGSPSPKGYELILQFLFYMIYDFISLYKTEI